MDQILPHPYLRDAGSNRSRPVVLFLVSHLIAMVLPPWQGFPWPALRVSAGPECDRNHSLSASKGLDELNEACAHALVLSFPLDVDVHQFQRFSCALDGHISQEASINLSHEDLFGAHLIWLPPMRGQSLSVSEKQLRGRVPETLDFFVCDRCQAYRDDSWDVLACRRSDYQTTLIAHLRVDATIGNSIFRRDAQMEPEKARTTSTQH